MLDFNPTEFLVVAVVALIVIGPKDLPKVMRLIGKWVGRARGIARQFRSGIDEMIRESELAELQKQWAAENERIMREHPPAPALPAPMAALGDASATADADGEADAGPVMVAQPALHSDPEPAPKPAPRPRKRKPAAASSDEPAPAKPRTRKPRTPE